MTYWTKEYKNYFRIQKREENEQECAIEKYIEREYQRTGIRPISVNMVCFLS